MAGVIRTATATIPAGQSESNSIDLTSALVTMLIAPDDWNAGPISFLTSVDNSNFYSLFDRSGAEVNFRFVRGVAMPVEPEMTRSTVYLKIRSGTAKLPIVQDAARSFLLVLTT